MKPTQASQGVLQIYRVYASTDYAGRTSSLCMRMCFSASSFCSFFWRFSATTAFFLENTKLICSSAAPFSASHLSYSFLKAAEPETCSMRAVRSLADSAATDSMSPCEPNQSVKAADGAHVISGACRAELGYLHLPALMAEGVINVLIGPASLVAS